MRERSIRSSRVRAISVHAALDRREHPQPEQVDLEEARVRAGVLVPLAQLAALHRRRQRPGSSRSAGGWRRSSRPSAGRDGAAGRRPRRTAAPATPSGRAARRGAVRRPHAPRRARVAAVDHGEPFAGGHRERGAGVGVDQARAAPPGSSPSAVSTSAATPRTAHGSAPRATRSSSPGGRPSTLPSSRIAPRERNVGKAATSAECSRP